MAEAILENQVTVCGIARIVLDVEDGGEVTNYGTEVDGTMDCATGLMEGWILELCPADSSLECETLQEETTSTTIDAVMDPTLRENGEHMLRLSVFDDEEEVVATHEQSLTITGQHEIGHVSLSFPVAGLS